jgi:methylenetetrahydrofolate--tRNA-(uracil-5-)-methyltransferase
MHRNTFIDAPKCLRATLQAQVSERLLVAGQLTGVEGYVESIGAGLVAGLNAARIALGSEPLVPRPETMLGALLSYITTPSPDFQPMNANFGLLPSCPGRGRERRAAQSERALAATRTFAGSAGLD